MSHRTRAVLLGSALLAVSSGCSDDPGVPATNQLPTAEITSSVPAEGGNVVHHVEIHFVGRDTDGVVVEFEYLLHTYPRRVGLYQDVQVPVIADDDPRWTSTAGQESQFFVDLVVAADTLRADPSGDIGNGHFDRWHTFFLRAVDNSGGKSTPASRTFDAYTLAPSVWLLDPAKPGPEVAQLPRSFVMRWYGVDDVGEGTTQDPVAVRWALVELCAGPNCNSFQVPDSLYALAEARWSDWIPWAVADTLREARFLDLVTPGTGDWLFAFAVQGLDEAGAITPKFADSPLGTNNYATLRVDSSLPVGPGLPVRETKAGLGDWVFAGDQAQPIQVTATGVDSLALEWGPMQTLHYGGKGRDYRYGWDITNPADDGQWTSWAVVRSAPPHALGTSGGTFWLQARDHLGLRTEARIVFQK